MHQLHTTSQACSHHPVSSHHCLPKAATITTQLFSGSTSTHLHAQRGTGHPNFNVKIYQLVCLFFPSAVLPVVYHQPQCDKVTVFNVKDMSPFCIKLAENHTVLFFPSFSLLHALRFPPFIISLIS